MTQSLLPNPFLGGGQGQAASLIPNQFVQQPAAPAAAPQFPNLQIDPNALTATEQLTTRREREEKLESETSKLGTVATQAARGILDVVLTPGVLLGLGAEAGSAALGLEDAEEFGRNVRLASSGESALKTLAFGAGGLGEQGLTYAEKVQKAIDDQEAAWPTLSAIARGAGIAAGAVATAGLGAANLGIGGTAALGAAESAAGAVQNLDENEPLKDVLTSALLWGTAGAVLAGGGTFASRKFSQVAETAKRQQYDRVFGQARKVGDEARTAGPGAVQEGNPFVSDLDEFQGTLKTVVKNAQKKVADPAFVDSATRPPVKFAGAVPTAEEAQAAVSDLGVLNAKHLSFATTSRPDSVARTRQLIAEGKADSFAPIEIDMFPAEEGALRVGQPHIRGGYSVTLSDGRHRAYGLQEAGVTKVKANINVYDVDGNVVTRAENVEVPLKPEPLKQNPRAQQAAAAEKAYNEAVDELASKAKPIDPKSWENQKYTPTELFLQRDEILNRAAEDLTRSGNKLHQGTEKLLEQFRRFDLKEDVIAKNLEGVDLGQAQAATWQWLADVTQGLDNTLANPPPGLDWKASSRLIKASRANIRRAIDDVSKAETPAQAFIAADRFGRNIDKIAENLTKAADKGFDVAALEARPLAQWADDAYRRTRHEFLRNEGVWGDQARAQQLFNDAWTDQIGSGKYGMNRFMQRVGDNRQTRRPIYAVDQLALRRNLDDINKTPQGQRLVEWYRDTANVLQAYKKWYSGVDDATLKEVDELISVAESAAKKFSVAEKAATAPRTLEAAILEGVARQGQAAVPGAFAVAGSFLGPAGAIAGGILGQAVSNTVRPNVMSLLPLLTRAKGAAARTRERAAQALPDVIAGAGRSAKRTTDVLRQTPRILNPGAQIEQYQRRLDYLVNETQNPDLEQQAQDLAELGAPEENLPDIAIARAQKLAQLRDDLPKPEETWRGAAYSSLSRSQLQEANAMWEATMQPMSVFDDFRAGAIDYTKVRYAWRQYPGLQTAVRAGINDLLHVHLTPKQRLNLPETIITQLDYLGGFGGTLQPSLSFDFAQRITAAYQAQVENQQSRPTQAGLQLPGSQPTFAQRIAGARQ